MTDERLKQIAEKIVKDIFWTAPEDHVYKVTLRLQGLVDEVEEQTEQRFIEALKISTGDSNEQA